MDGTTWSKLKRFLLLIGKKNEEEYNTDEFDSMKNNYLKAISYWDGFLYAVELLDYSDDSEE